MRTLIRSIQEALESLLSNIETMDEDEIADILSYTELQEMDIAFWEMVELTQ